MGCFLVILRFGLFVLHSQICCSRSDSFMPVKVISITAPARDLLSAVIFNPPFMLSNVKLTPQLDLGSANTGHCQFQIRPLGVETGQYRTAGAGRSRPLAASKQATGLSTQRLSSKGAPKRIDYARLSWFAKP